MCTGDRLAPSRPPRPPTSRSTTRPPARLHLLFTHKCVMHVDTYTYTRINRRGECTKILSDGYINIVCRK